MPRIAEAEVSRAGTYVERQKQPFAFAPAVSGKRSTNTSLRAKAWDTAMPLKEGAPATGSRLG